MKPLLKHQEFHQYFSTNKEPENFLNNIEFQDHFFELKPE